MFLITVFIASAHIRLLNQEAYPTFGPLRRSKPGVQNPAPMDRALSPLGEPWTYATATRTEDNLWPA